MIQKFIQQKIAERKKQNDKSYLQSELKKVRSERQEVEDLANLKKNIKKEKQKIRDVKTEKVRSFLSTVSKGVKKAQQVNAQRSKKPKAITVKKKAGLQPTGVFVPGGKK